MRYFLLCAFAGAVVLAAGAFARQSVLAPLPAGWAVGGTATNPQSQVSSDTSCGSNSVLLFSARGSGDKYGGDLQHNKIGAWTQGAGIELIHEGWNVRDLQAIYPAPPVPSFKEIALAVLKYGGLNTRSAAAVALIVKQFRDVASNSWQAVKAQLEAAYNRCPNRKILLAGYSQGAILLRYIAPRLSAQIRQRIVSVDLFADPTEQRSVDSGLQHPANLDGRLTTEGIDTFSGLVLNGGSFRQTGYAQPSRTYQYCVPNDLVCEFNLGNLAASNIFNEGKIHASYAFELNGIAAAKRAGRFSPPTPTIPGSVGTCGAYAVGPAVVDVSYQFTERPGVYSFSLTTGFFSSIPIGDHSTIWGLATGTGYLKIFRTQNNDEICLENSASATFRTIASASPHGTGTVGDGLTGSLTGRQAIIWPVGQFRPQKPVAGDLGNLLSACTAVSGQNGATCPNDPLPSYSWWFESLGKGGMGIGHTSTYQASNGTTMTESWVSGGRFTVVGDITS